MIDRKSNIFRATPEYPYHISVGAVVVNEKNEILCHHFDEINVHGVLIKDLYILMRESLELGETLEEAVARGLQEEFGAKGEILSSLGVIVAQHHDRGFLENKSTLYFLVKCTELNPENRAKNDIEAGSKLAFYGRDFLISKMKDQGKDLNRTDLDESKIIKRIIF